MQTYLIYLATNTVNQKKYIGQTKSGRLDRRIFEHLQDAKIQDKNVAFHNALNKYGIDNFTIEVIEEDIPAELIDEREQYWINYYNTYIHAENSQGYNETVGGQGTRGYVFTDEDRQKMSNRQKQYWAELPEKDPEEYARLCEIRRQNKLKDKWTDESRQKLSSTVRKQYQAGRAIFGREGNEFAAQLAKANQAPLITTKSKKQPKNKVSQPRPRIAWNKGKTGLPPSYNKGLSSLPNICQFDLNTGELIKKYTTSRIAAEAISVGNDISLKEILNKTGRIFAVCQANKGHAYGYIWRFDTGIDCIDPIIVLQEHRSPRAKAILQYDLDSNLIAEFESAAAYSKTMTNNYSEQRRIAKKVSSACNSSTKIYNGYIWKFKE